MRPDADWRTEVRRFDAGIAVDRAETPPASWYLDPAIHRAELATVFARSWQAVARTDQVVAAGEHAAGEIAGEPWVVVRGDDGQLRAFFNVCRHHAACVASGRGRVENLVCPYHGWTYGLDGRLLRAPGLGAAKDFQRERFGLAPMEVAVWDPLVFVRLEAAAEGLDALLAPLAGRIDRTGLRFVARRSWEMDCNWKVFVDNYLDGGYHVPHLHGGLAGQLDLGSYRTQVEGRVSLQTCGAGAEEPAPGTTGDFGARVEGGAVYAFVYPNLMINRYGPIMDTNWVVPLGPDRTLTIFDYWFREDLADDADFVARSLEASAEVQREDIAVCESVQRGLRSSSYDTGRYAPAVEFAMHHFHKMLAEDLHRAL